MEKQTEETTCLVLPGLPENLCPLCSVFGFVHSYTGERSQSQVMSTAAAKSPLQSPLCLLGLWVKTESKYSGQMKVFLKERNKEKANQEKEATLWSFRSWCWEEQAVRFHSTLFLPAHHHCRLLWNLSVFQQRKLGKLKPARSCLTNLQLPSFCMCLKASSFFPALDIGLT